MDLAETDRSLSNITNSMQIAIVFGGFNMDRSLNARTVVARPVPNAKILTLKGLKKMFASEWKQSKNFKLKRRAI